MRVSVIVPVYNHRLFLPECLMSVYAQDWDDLELVVVDDASTDGSSAIAARFSKISWVRSRFSCIVVDRNSQNMGAASTINRAILQSSGDVVMIVNSDDPYHPRRVISCVEAIRGGSRFVFTGIRCIDELGKPTFTEEAAHFDSTVREISRYPSVSLAMLEKNRAISTGNFCFTRELTTAVGLFRPLLYCHDWDFLLATVLETEPCWIEAPYYEYRLHRSNSFRPLARVAEAESRACFQRIFQAIDRRLVHNPTLRMYINEQTLWEGILHRAGAVAYSEWLDAKSGVIRRPISIDVRDSRAAQLTAGAATAPKALITSNAEALWPQISSELFLMRIEGDLYPDGWMGESLTLTFQVGSEARGIELDLYLGNRHEQRIAVSTLRGGARPAQEIMVVVPPGKLIPISFDLKDEARSFAISIRVPNAASQKGSDRRKLGVVIARLDIIGDKKLELLPNSGQDQSLHAKHGI